MNVNNISTNVLFFNRRKTRSGDQEPVEGETYDPYDFSDTEEEMPEGEHTPFCSLCKQAGGMYSVKLFKAVRHFILIQWNILRILERD